MKRNQILASCAIGVCLAVSAALGFAQVTPLAAPATNEPDTTLSGLSSNAASYDMMLTHLRAMTKEPHVSGSVAIEEVRAYLKAQLNEMGYSYETEDYTLSVDDILAIKQQRADARGKAMRSTAESVRDYADMGDADTLALQNILVKLDAPHTDRAVFIVAHYDSVKFGPGAADDLLAVTAMLESLRLMQGRTDLTNDLYFLFTDGEEQGLLGAACFVREHPEYQPITDLVFNLEARGNRGALVMFETSQNNLGLVRHYQKGVPTPVGFSVAAEVYKMMQNDTDLSEFIMAGYPGLNFAAVEGAENYHTPEDNYAEFDRGTGAHYLQTVVGFVNYLATADLSDAQTQQDAVFFPMFKGNLVVMSSRVAATIAWIASLAAVVWIAALLIRRKARISAVLLSMGMQVAALVATAGIGFGVVKLTATLAKLENTTDYLRFSGALPVFGLLLILAIVLAVSATVYAVRKTQSPLAVLGGVMPLFIAGSIGTAVAFNAASYLFSFTLLGLLLCAVLAQFVRGKAVLPVRAGSFLLAGAVTMLVFLPLVYLVYVALSLSMAPLVAAIAVLPLSAFFAAGVPVLAALDQKQAEVTQVS